MSARTDEEKQRLAKIKGRHPRNVSRRSALLISMRNTSERTRKAHMAIPGVREELNRKQTVFSEFYMERSRKTLRTVPNATGKPDSEDCDFCSAFREVDTMVCPNCGKPLKG